MALFRTWNLVDQIGTLLEQEYQLIRAGDFDALRDLVSQKERLFDRLHELPRNTRQLEALKSLAERNQVILDATRDGIGAAIQRIERIIAAQYDLKTYDKSGQRSDYSDAAHKLEKRA